MKIIVSLTTFPAAVPYAAQAVRSILKGSVVPDRVVMYLAEPQFPGRAVPPELTAIDHPAFEVRWCERDIRSYKKLVPALADFPDDIIITVDDDIRFERRMVERLLRVHKKYPDAIVGHRVRRIETDRAGELKPYRQWKRYKEWRFLTRNLAPAYRNLLTGGAGGLYPPRSLDETMLDPDIFMADAPTTDDIWFWAAAVSRGTKTVPVPFGYWKLHELGKPDRMALSTTNLRSGTDVNRAVAERIFEKYPAIKQKLLK